MIADHVCKWVENLKPRVRQYLYYQDTLEETMEKIKNLQGREKLDCAFQMIGDFFSSDFYNADFDPWPDLDTRIDTIEDLLKLVENDIDRKKLENSVESIFREEEAAQEGTEQLLDQQQKAFFSMMTDAYGINEFYNTVERSKTEVTEILAKEGLTESSGNNGEVQPEIEYDSEGAESLKARLADILDGHVDSF